MRWAITEFPAAARAVTPGTRAAAPGTRKN